MNGWSRVFLANKLNISPSTLWRWEKDSNPLPTTITLALTALEACTPLTGDPTQ